MKSVSLFAAMVEVAVGIGLVASPSLVSQLLVGEGVAGAGAVLGRIGGIGLLSLGVAGWPNSERLRGTPSLRGLLCYNLLVTVYLIYVGIAGDSVGVMLWPAVAMHGTLTVLFSRSLVRRDAGSVVG